MRLAILFIWIMCCFSCKQKKQPKQFDSKKIISPSKAKTDSTTKKIDSFFHNALEKALIIAKVTKKESYSKNFSVGRDDLYNKVDLKVKFGNLFSSKYKNLLIVSSSKIYTKINIYAV